MKEKAPLSHEVVCFEMLEFGTSNSKLEVSKSNSWKNYFFHENYVTSEAEPFLTTFYSVNLFPLLVIK